MSDSTLTTQLEKFADDLAVQIRSVQRALKARIRQHGGERDLTPSQISVLVRLETEGGMTISRLARLEGMRSQSMSEIVAPLRALDLVEGFPDPNDGRQILISLSQHGKSWIAQGRATSQDWLRSAIVEKLSLEEQQQLEAGIRLLRRAIED